MAGHSHWKQIKEHKGNADVKRGALFSKLLRAISIAARTEPNPQFNPRLRTAIETAREANVPADTIERAISKATDVDALEEILMEAYGPGGAALLIYAITSSKNRTVGEVKLVLKQHDAKWAEPGSVLWAFEERRDDSGATWRAKFPLAISPEDAQRLTSLTSALADNDDVQTVFTNATT
jgi:YebC/PmpR family DNA-binding regulatory protein